MMYSSWCMLHTFDTLYTYITETEVLSMKQFCKCALRAYMAKCLAKARKESNLTQSKLAEKLMMDTRSYVSLEHGKSLCCTLTFIIYLCFFGKDVEELICDLRNIILSSYNDERPAS